MSLRLLTDEQLIAIITGPEEIKNATNFHLYELLTQLKDTAGSIYFEDLIYTLGCKPIDMFNILMRQFNIYTPGNIPQVKYIRAGWFGIGMSLPIPTDLELEAEENEDEENRPDPPDPDSYLYFTLQGINEIKQVFLNNGIDISVFTIDDLLSQTMERVNIDFNNMSNEEDDDDEYIGEDDEDE